MLDYGIVGNCMTCALIKRNASIDWLCFPAFSDPSVFAKILDEKKGGSFSIIPVGKYRITQKYISNTAILETSFTGTRNAFVIYDFFPRYNKLTKNGHRLLIKENRLVRIIKPVKGKPIIKICYEPRPDYARKKCEYSQFEDKFICSTDDKTIALVTNVSFKNICEKKEVSIDRTKYFVIENGTRFESVRNVNDCMKLFSATKKYWENWCEGLVLPKNNSSLITRSLITLKLLTYSPTGAIIAAATTSIPEEIGSERTWDYRYCWVRDASFCVDAMEKLGRSYESKELMKFILKAAVRDDFIQPIYTITGETDLPEYELAHLEGFRGTGPVRVGNAAYRQRQNDIYGAVIDIFYLYFVYYQYEKRLTEKYWRLIKYIVNQIKFNWDKKDSSIWEYRNLEDHYTYSKFMCWVGVDRAIKIARHFGKEEFTDGWIKLSEKIKDDIMRNGYKKEIGSFTISYGRKDIDASLLLMCYHEFLPSDDPWLINTVKAIYKNLRHGDKVKRYDMNDDFGQSESSFTICTFWLIDALHYIGEDAKARKLFSKIIKRGNHLGLFSEDIDMKTGKLMGNFPQAYTHIALINSAVLLSEWSAKRKKIDWGFVHNHKKKGF
ncbi:MAG: glycoside hydrolase family 15 protein [Candidatus Aenigmarchaeota archaeon]|nr:glycoside hydrolase family 15 protein [Candidatus Aenigmarchaeota archaeon]